MNPANKRNSLRYWIHLLALVFLAVTISTSIGMAKEINLKMTCVLGPGTALFKAANSFADRIAEKTEGQVKIKVYAPGTLIGPTEVFEALGKGVIDLAYTTGEYWAGKEIAFSFVTYLPGGFDSPVQHDFWLYQRGGLELVRKLYEPHNIQLLSLPYYPAEYLISRVPIKTLEDIKGKKLVFSGALQHALFNKLGASTVTMPAGERVASLERGVIDGGDFAAPNNLVALGAHRVAKYILKPSLHQPSSALELSMNMKEWKALPENFKRIFADEAYDNAWRTYRYSLDMDLEAFKELKAAGVTEFELSDEEVKKVREMAMEVWKETAKNSPMGQELLQSQMAVMKELGLIQ